MEQRAETKKPSIHVCVRLNEDDQEKLATILEAHLADNISDAIRCGLFFGERAARRIVKKRSDA